MPGPFSVQEIQSLAGQPVYDADGDKIGQVEEVYLDDATQQPEWVGIGVGLFGSRHVLVPLEGAERERDGVRVRFAKEKVKDSPDVKEDTDNHISEQTERDLYTYYGLSFSEAPSPSTLPDGQTAGQDVTRTVASKREGRGRLQHLQLREEELRPRTESVQTGEVRVTKDMVEEQKTIEVPTTREEVTIDRRPVEGRPPASGPVGTDEEIRVPVHEDQVQVDKETVVREEVDVNTQQVQEAQTVEETVRREEPRIDRRS